MALERFHNVSDVRKAAAAALPRPIFDYIDGGADDEITQRRNIDAFSGYDLLPSVLGIDKNLRVATRTLGCHLSWPLILSPTGLTRMFHDDAEIAVARAAERHGIPYCLSTLATTTIEDLAQNCGFEEVIYLLWNGDLPKRDELEKFKKYHLYV